MSEDRPIESILAADIGSTLTHVCLIDLVEGTYRFIAHAETASTLGGAESDLTIGLRRAIRQLEQVTSRTLLEGETLITPEQDSGDGVDTFLATSSAAPPLECVIVGLTDDLSRQSAESACAASHALVVAGISLGTRGRSWDNRIIAQLRHAPPDLILMVGGIDGGPTAPLESAARVLITVYEDIAADQRPAIVFAGNQEARRPVADMVSPLFDLRVVDNVRPNVYTESLGELQRELVSMYTSKKLATVPGYRELRRWCNTPILSTTEALSTTFRFIARGNELAQGVLGVDVGGATTYVGAARQDVYQWAIGAALGTSYGVHRLLDQSGYRDVDRWLPISLDREEMIARLENTRLRPYGIPQTMEDLLLAQALVRQALLLTMRRVKRQFWHPSGTSPEADTTPAFDVLAARGGAISHTPQDGLLALTLLDAVQPTGLTRLVVDWASIWPQLGALAQIVPLAATQVLERDSFRELGTVLAPIGETRDGERALSLKITVDDGQVTEDDIPTGEIRCYPLALDQQATIEARPNRYLDIGLGQKGVGGRSRIRGGSLGLIVDTRGRPLSLPQDTEVCRAKIQQWLGNLIQDANSP